MMSKTYSIVVLKLNEFQRKVLKKSAVLEIDNPPAEVLDYVTDVLQKAGQDPIKVLALLLHASERTMTTFTEFKYDKDPDENGNVEKGTIEIATHLFEIVYPTPSVDELELSSFKDKVFIADQKEKIDKVKSFIGKKE